jgi:biotin operon repressor
MERDNPPDLQVEGWLKTLGVELLCQWDVLVFLYRHQSSLVSAEHIARFLGYATAEVVTALDSLESPGLVGRSRESQGVRFYQLTALPALPPKEGESGVGRALERLMTLVDSRTLRVLQVRRLLGGTP